jgi:hypothetical protein
MKDFLAFCSGMFIVVMIIMSKNPVEMNHFNDVISKFNFFSSTPNCSGEMIESTIKNIILDDTKGDGSIWYTFVKKTINESSFTLSNIRPTNVQNSIKKINCSANIEIVKKKYPITYTVQKTEDRIIYVELDISPLRDSLCGISCLVGRGY